MALIEIDRLSWPEVGRQAARDPIAVVPLGALEQHGPHLPLAMDTIAVEHVVRAAALSVPADVVVLPTLPYGMSSHHLAFPGTISIDACTLTDTLAAFVEGVAGAGVRKVALVSHHGGNFASMTDVVRRFADRAPGLLVRAFDDLSRYLEIERAAAQRAGLEVCASDIHAGAIETSIMLELGGGRLPRAWEGVDGHCSDDVETVTRALSDGVQALSASGVLGDPGSASAVAGREILDALRDELASWLAETFPDPEADRVEQLRA